MSLACLGIDAERLVGPRAGVARYLSALLREWAEMTLPFERVTLYSPSALSADTLPDGHPYAIRLLPERGPRAAWAHWTLARAARDVDVLFCPSYVVPLAYGGPSVVTIHDAVHEAMPETFSWRSRWTRRPLYRLSARRADLVLTDSLSSKADLEHAYQLPGDRIVAIPLGVDRSFSEIAPDERSRIRDRYGLGRAAVFLFVGKFSRRRNLPTLVQAFAKLLGEHELDVLLVLAGDDFLHLGLADLARELGVDAMVRMPGHVPDEDLPGLYAAARIFVYPSDYEGFGLPVLEAMAAGTPVVTLDNSSLSEVAGDAALLLPEATVDGLAEAMWRLLSDDALRAELVRKGEVRARQFSWRTTALTTMTALAQVAAGLAEGGPIG
jgi:glycosyltransferase involved in cell wall biosynthesis